MELGKHTRENFVWNTVGSIFESALNFILLIVVNRTAGETAGGLYTLAFSHAQLMYYLGTLEVRPLHSTDVRQKYSFADYFSLRTLSCIFMMAVCLIYVLAVDGDGLKKRVMMYVCIYKMLDAFHDLFACLFQQRDRIAFAGQVSTVKVILGLGVFIACLVGTGSLELACLAMAGVSLAVLLTFNLSRWRVFPDAAIRFRFRHAPEIAKASFPLFVSVFVMLYISNAPKYAIDEFCSDVVQNRYSILFMPAFAINLFSQFLIRPLLTTMARIWNDGDYPRFRKQIVWMICGLAGVTLLGVGGAWLLGIPILQLLYHVDLTEERTVLLFVMIYGGLNALNIFLYDMIAVTRNQTKLMVAYLIAAAVVFLLASPLVRSSGMYGAIWSSMTALGTLDLLLLGILFWVLKKKLQPAKDLKEASAENESESVNQ